LSQNLEAVALAQLTAASTLLRTRSQRRQKNTFNPDSAAVFGDSTNVADPSFGTVIAAGCPGPMTSYAYHALAGRSGTMSYGIKPDFALPLCYGISEDKQSYWWIVTDSSNQGNAQQLEVNFAFKLWFAAQDMDGDDMTAAEQLKIANNTIYGRKGKVGFSPVWQIIP
jgi:hypothetical protein